MGTAVGGFALNQCGLIPFYPGLVFQTVPSPSLDRWFIIGNVLFYLPEIDADDKYIHHVSNQLLGAVRVPTQERALVDYLKCFDMFDLGHFYDGIEEYGYIHDGDWSELEKVATEYGLWEEMKFHIKEAYETSSAGY